MILVKSNCAAVYAIPASVNPLIETTAHMASAPEQLPDVAGLTARMSRGDEAAFHQFNELYFRRLLRYLIVVADGREEIAREALQLTFVRVARYVRRFESEAAFWGWLTVLARSSFADETRKRSRYQNLLARFFHLRPAEADASGRDADEQLLKLLQIEMAGLPPDERALLKQKYIDGQAVRGLAKELQLTEKALDSRLVRIRRKLKTAVLDRLRHETTD